MSYIDLNLRLPELLLMRVDKMTMGASVEARVPFLDHELVSLVIGLTQTVKIPGGRLKHLLKEAVGGLLPREIVDRPKQGFRVPVNEWLLEGIGPTADAVLDDFARQHPYLRADYKQQFERPLNGAQTWYLLNLALWHRHWIEQRPMPESVLMAASA